MLKNLIIYLTKEYISFLPNYWSSWNYVR